MKGLEKGLEKGREEGLKEGIEEGKHQEKLEIARLLLQKGLSIEFVCRVAE